MVINDNAIFYPGRSFLSVLGSYHCVTEK